MGTSPVVLRTQSALVSGAGQERKKSKLGFTNGSRVEHSSFLVESRLAQESGEVDSNTRLEHGVKVPIILQSGLQPKPESSTS